jgi:alkylation response protein AidB-like acyl-CoA dehydrogenase
MSVAERAEPTDAKTDRLDGHVASSSALSTREAFRHLSMLSKPLIDYRPRVLWEQDTRSLPTALADYRRQVRLFAERHLRPRTAYFDTRPHGTNARQDPELGAVLELAAENGFLSDILPTPLGSVPWARYRHSLALQQAIKVEELARVCGGLMLLISAHNLGAAPLLLSGDLSAARRFLWPALKSNNAGKPHLFAYAITEPGAGSDVEDGHGASLYQPGVVARKVPGGWSLSGRKCFISGGDVADSVTVFAALEGEGMESWTCFLVPASSRGFELTRTELKMGMRASGAAELLFDHVVVGHDHVIGGLRRGWAINRSILNLSRLPVAAMAVGFAQGATELAMDFACQYRVGGKALIQYQEIQLQIAQMVAQTSSIRALVWQYAQSWVSVQGRAALCKFQCSDVAVRVCERAMELMGCHGGSYALGVEKLFRDARLTQIFEGTNQINRLALIEDMQEELLARMG